MRAPRCRRFGLVWPALLLAAAVGADTGDAYPMPETVIAASRLTAGDDLGRVLVVGPEELARQPALSIADLLARLPGLDIRARGEAGVQADLEMGGATFSQVLILLDGVRVSDPRTAHHDLNLPLTAGDLERVEVLYGAGSSVHGPDAFGGVVHLVPKRTSGASAVVGGHWGRFLDPGAGRALGADASARWGRAGERGALWLAAGKRRSDGYREGTDADESRLYGRAARAAGRGELVLSSGFQAKDFGARDFYGPYPSRERTRLWLHTAGYSRPLPGGRLAIQGHYRRHGDRFVLVADDPDLYRNRHLNQRLGLESHLVLGAGPHAEVVLGGEAAVESIASSNLGDRRRGRAGAFAEYGKAWGPWAARAAMRLDRGQRYGWQVAPALTASRGLGGHREYVSASRAFRAPTFTELHYRDPANQGNPALAPESAWVLEAGAHLRPAPGWQAEGSTFLRLERDLVDYVRPPGEAVWRARNLGRMRTRGLATRLAGRWRGLEPQVGYAWVRKQRRLAPDLESKYVFTHPRHQLTASLRHPLGPGLEADWLVVAKERGTLGDYATVDLSLRRAFPGGSAALRLRNLADARYQAVAGVPAPGRWAALEAQREL
ncbi:MAG: TonB-dependent receptor [Gemmatimonadota bacterium]